MNIESFTVSPPPGVRNDFLDRLHEIVPPEPVAWTPQTVGWYLLGAALVALLIWVVWRGWRRWSAGRFRREALAELQAIEARLGTTAERVVALRLLPDLLKRTALAVRPRAEVASLHGSEWLEYLDGSLGSTEFTDGPGRLVSELTYLPDDRIEAIEQTTARELVGTARKWIRKAQ